MNDGMGNSVQSAAIARSQHLLDIFCGSSPGRWAILQLLRNQARRKLMVKLAQKLSSKSCDRVIDTLCTCINTRGEFPRDLRRFEAMSYELLTL